MADFFSPGGFNGDVAGLLATRQQFRASHEEVMALTADLAVDAAVERQLTDDANEGARPYGVGVNGE